MRSSTHVHLDKVLKYSLRSFPQESERESCYIITATRNYSYLFYFPITIDYAFRSRICYYVLLLNILKDNMEPNLLYKYTVN